MRRFAELADTIAIHRDRGASAAHAAVRAGEGKRPMDSIRDITAEMERIEADHRDELQNVAESRIHRSIALMFVSTVFGLSVVGFGFYLIQREIIARRQLAEGLQDADRKKNDFLALVGHELRNPLAAITNAADVLHLLGNLDETGEEMRAIINRQIVFMTRLVTDLLDTARVAHGKLELTQKSTRPGRTAAPHRDRRAQRHASRRRPHRAGIARRTGLGVGRCYAIGPGRGQPGGQRGEILAAQRPRSGQVAHFGRRSPASHDRGDRPGHRHGGRSASRSVFEPFVQGVAARRSRPPRPGFGPGPGPRARRAARRPDRRPERRTGARHDDDDHPAAGRGGSGGKRAVSRHGDRRSGVAASW